VFLREQLFIGVKDFSTIPTTKGRVEAD